jgi:hypothetical protein
MIGAVSLGLLLCRLPTGRVTCCRYHARLRAVVELVLYPKRRARNISGLLPPPSWFSSDAPHGAYSLLSQPA